MLKKFSFIIFKILKFFNQIFYFLTRRSFLEWLMYFLSNDSYIQKQIKNKHIKFYAPNNLISWRVRTIFDKEPDTIEWIEKFNKKDDNNFIFWDIGANIGLYSLYCSCVHGKKSKIYAFEPSTSNLRVLSRNIYINNLQENIFINQLPLSNKPNIFLPMKENDFQEGVSLNTFGENFNFEGDEYIAKNEYSILGTSIDYMVEKNIMDVPDYIKIDVDGIEHLILEGGKQTLKNLKIKSILIEVNDNFLEQKNRVSKLMYDCGFQLIKKSTEKNIPVTKEFSNTFNYIYER
ncbi:FkbM family methyltransferase [Candidatus Pelagibacter sp.]|nr:FkbM family methyltransferase [Candidatus Pelagibacter sp.]